MFFRVLRLHERIMQEREAAWCLLTNHFNSRFLECKHLSAENSKASWRRVKVGAQEALDGQMHLGSGAGKPGNVPTVAKSSDDIRRYSEQ